MSERKRYDPEKRRDAVIDAALSLFTDKGFAATPVDEIVARAGVAKGTFYLYFKTKDDVLNAAVERMIDDMIGHILDAAESGSGSAADRLLTFSRALATLVTDPATSELSQAFHRPENRTVHNRLRAEASQRILPLFERIIADGIASGEFAVTDAHLCAHWVVGAYTGLDDSIADPNELPASLEHLNRFLLRGLGYDGETRR